MAWWWRRLGWCRLGRSWRRLALGALGAYAYDPYAYGYGYDYPYYGDYGYTYAPTVGGGVAYCEVTLPFV